jgi:hypothetical protein
MARLGDELRRGKTFRLFPETAFQGLASLQRLIRRSSPRDERQDWERSLKAQGLSSWGLEALDKLGFFKIVEEARASRRDEKNFRRHLQTGFAALKTFQWMKALAAETGEPEFREGLNRSSFLGISSAERETPLSLLERLRTLDEAQPTAEAAF